MTVSESKYKNLYSIVLENNTIRVELVPGAGARTASLLYIPKLSELLWQNPALLHAPVRYAQPFPEGEAAGFDEMFPTINECSCPDVPWKGTVLPDHGEVWALPWHCEINKDSDSVLLSVNGVRLPYLLSKRIWLNGSVLKAVYSVENPTPYPMPFIYAAHPLFNVSPGDCIIVPDNLKAITNAVPSVSLPDYGKDYPWSEVFSVMPQKTTTGYKKYYFNEKNTEGWSALRRESLGLEIKMLVSTETLPYLGIWMNEGGWADQYNLALEPASASMDDLIAARSFNKESILKPYEVREWEIDIAVSEF